MKRVAHGFVVLSALLVVIPGIRAEPLFRVLRDGLWGFINARGEVVVEPMFDHAFRYSNGYTVVRTGDYETGRRAFMDESGRLITDFVFDRAFHFVGGYGIGVIDQKWGFLAGDGSLLTGYRFDGVIPFADGFAGVRIGTNDARWGIIDSAGREVLPVAYPRLRYIDDGYWAVGRSWTEWALYRPPAPVPEAFPYRAITAIHEGHLIASLTTDSGVVHVLVDPSGRTLYESPSFIHGYSQGLVLGSVEGHLRYLFPDGTPIIDQSFFSASPFQDGIARVSVGSSWSDQRWGILSINGRFVMSPRYNWLGEFDASGIARFRVGDLFGFVDRTGREISAPLWDQTGSFADGLAPVLRDGLWGYINTSGEIVIHPQFDYAWDFAGGRAVVRYGDHETGHRFYIDASGRAVTPARYDWAYTFVDGLAHVAFGDFHSGTFGYVDSSGEVVWEPSH